MTVCYRSRFFMTESFTTPNVNDCSLTFSSRSWGMVTKVAVPNIFYRYTKNTYNTNSHYHHTKQRTRVTTTTKTTNTTRTKTYYWIGVVSYSRSIESISAIKRLFSCSTLAYGVLKFDFYSGTSTKYVYSKPVFFRWSDITSSRRLRVV